MISAQQYMRVRFAPPPYLNMYGIHYIWYFVTRTFLKSSGSGALSLYGWAWTLDLFAGLSSSSPAGLSTSLISEFRD